MIWNIAAPFFRPDGDGQVRWIDDFVPPGRHEFRKIGFEGVSGGGWHQRAARGTPLGTWASHWRTGGAVLAGADGVITVFPQLALTSAIHRALGRRHVPIVAWCFNLGTLHGGFRRAAARAALRRVERFVVHSSAEVPLIADYLGIAHDRVRFVPLQRAPIAITDAEEEEAPFALAMGSANRDYPTLVEAARRTGLPLTIVASPRNLAGLDVPATVTLRSGLTAAQCRVLAQRARLSIVPLADVGAASGQVTVVEAQRMARPVIATRSIGTTDYIEDGKTGMFVRQSDPDDLARTIMALWNDRARRDEIATAGARFAEDRLSDAAAARALLGILNELADGR